jgi:hypothetical protein
MILVVKIKSTRNRRACMRNLMTVEEAKGVCKDRSKWNFKHFLPCDLCLPQWETGVMYVCCKEFVFLFILELLFSKDIRVTN